MRYQLQFLFLLIVTNASFLHAQEVDLNNELDSGKQKPKTEYINYTFQSSRIINGHSIEIIPKGMMDFRIAHRFGTLNGGFYELFGLDNASMRMSFDFGLAPNLMVGVGRSTYQKQYDGFVKYRFLRQSKGERTMPISAAIASSVMLTTLKWQDPTRENLFSSRLQYAHQLILARKFSEGTSLQLMPTLVHYNLVTKATDPNDILALGIGGRQRITQMISVNAEYYYLFPGSRFEGTTNSFSMGFDIETGGHVFQLHFTNSRGMTERTFISETAGSWGKGNILFGFNISRMFNLQRKRR
ncbi:MAG: hypothetical protein GXC73_03930 [Chitinophagaceae bacterium]|nr:hypothetical protein [Chitinophagaceae bacterium]